MCNYIDVEVFGHMSFSTFIWCTCNCLLINLIPGTHGPDRQFFFFKMYMTIPFYRDYVTKFFSLMEYFTSHFRVKTIYTTYNIYTHLCLDLSICSLTNGDSRPTPTPLVTWRISYRRMTYRKIYQTYVITLVHNRFLSFLSGRFSAVSLKTLHVVP